MGYIPHTDSEREAMLRAIGVKSVDELFADVPARHRFPKLNLPDALSEMEAVAELRDLAEANVETQSRGMFPGRRRLQPLHPVGRRSHAAARRVLHRLHALSARDHPGHAAGASSSTRA